MVLELDGKFLAECCCCGVNAVEVGPGLDKDIEGGLPLALFFDADCEGDAPAMAAASERERWSYGSWTPVASPVNGDVYTDISPENAVLLGQRLLTRGVEYLVEASVAEAEAISATLAAVKARQNGETEQPPDRDGSSEATRSGKQTSLIKVAEPVLQSNDSYSIPSPRVRLHHRVVVVAAEAVVL